jgi:hypothetical protein
MASASALDRLNCAVSAASSGRGEGRKIKDALLARETVVQVDDFAGRAKAKHVELAPRSTLSSLAERLNDGRLPDGKVVANLESEIRKLYEVGGRRFRVALLPTEIPASREPGLLLDPRRYGIENTTDKVRRPGAVRRRRDTVCTERIVGNSEIGQQAVAVSKRVGRREPRTGHPLPRVAAPPVISARPPSVPASSCC